MPAGVNESSRSLIPMTFERSRDPLVSRAREHEEDENCGDGAEYSPQAGEKRNHVLRCWALVFRGSGQHSADRNAGFTKTGGSITNTSEFRSSLRRGHVIEQYSRRHDGLSRVA